MRDELWLSPERPRQMEYTLTNKTDMMAYIYLLDVPMGRIPNEIALGGDRLQPNKFSDEVSHPVCNSATTTHAYLSPHLRCN